MIIDLKQNFNSSEKRMEIKWKSMQKQGGGCFCILENQALISKSWFWGCENQNQKQDQNRSKISPKYLSWNTLISTLTQTSLDQINRWSQLNPYRLTVPSGTNDILCSPRAVLGADGRELDPLGLEVENICDFCRWFGGGTMWFVELLFANRLLVVFLCGWNRCGVGGGPMLVWREKPCSIMPLPGNFELDLEPSAGMNREVVGTIADWFWFRPWWRTSLCSLLAFWKVFELVCGGSVGTYAYCLTHFSKYMRLLILISHLLEWSTWNRPLFRWTDEIALTLILLFIHMGSPEWVMLHTRW